LLLSQNASEAGAWCVQESNGERVGSEDCLFLNLFAPKEANLAPVFFYVHGGGFVTGHAELNAWNLTKTKNVIFLAPQYRIGVFGAFDKNYGLEDQILALKWTKENIEYFGGDPDNILLVGCSAGGASVANLLVSGPPGHFKAAVIGSPGSHLGWIGDEDSVRTNDDFMSLSLRQKNVAILQNEFSHVQDKDIISTDLLFSTSKVLRFAPATTVASSQKKPFSQRRQKKKRRKTTIQEEETSPLREIMKGNAMNKVPVIVGGQSCESCADAATFLGPPSEGTTFNQLRDAIAKAGFDSIIGVDTILKWYEPRRRQEGNWRVFARILSDSSHACSAVLHARALASQKLSLNDRMPSSSFPANVFSYFFAYDADVKPYPGSTHCNIEDYIFHANSDKGKSDLIANALSTWFTNLLLTGDPNNSSSLSQDDNTVALPYWDAFQPSSSMQQVMYLGLDDDPNPFLDTTQDTLRPECDYWEPYLI